MQPRRVAFFLVVSALTASSLVALAQQPAKKPGAPPAAKPAPAAAKPGAPAAKPAGKAGPRRPDAGDALDAPPPLATKEERAQPASSPGKDAGGAGAVLEQKTLDGGAKVFRFGEVEVEGRLKSPQIVYFLRRVRAEFAAGDLGHRTFMRELGETRNEPGF